MAKNKKNIECIGVIMDGNRRWAKNRGKWSNFGHDAGYEKIKELLKWSKEVGVGCVIVYAFSTENWGRSKREVNYLMNLFRRMIDEKMRLVHEEKVRVRFLGFLKRFPKDVQDLIKKLEEESKIYKGNTLALALSYGGRGEIISAIKKLNPKRIQSLTEEDFSKHLWTSGMPEPDIIIRTGGEMRLSNFLPWQSTYSELFFTKTYWPDFSKKEFSGILEEYYGRQRRMGK